MKRAMIGVCACGIVLALYGLTDAITTAGDKRAELAHAMRESCMPTAGQTAIIVSDGRIARCRIYSSASQSRGMAPRLISAAAVEIEVAP